MLVYLSPSDQEGNTYATGNTNEAEQCRKIADVAEKILNKYGIKTINNQTFSMINRVKQSNSNVVDLHICIHTNASSNSKDGKASGTRVFYHSESAKGYLASKYVFDHLSKVSDGAPDKLSAYDALYEIKCTKAPAVYCECEFHDNPKYSDFIINNTYEIGKAIALGVLDYFGISVRNEYEKYYIKLGSFEDHATAEEFLNTISNAIIEEGS